jgi:dipeptidyl aminopeptidase/acylaminoacyl peptidase
MNPLVRTAAPILIAQGTADTTVFPVYTDQLKDELVSAGDQVTYAKYPGANHVGVVTSGEADAMAFFQQMLPPRS